MGLLLAPEFRRALGRVLTSPDQRIAGSLFDERVAFDAVLVLEHEVSVLEDAEDAVVTPQFQGKIVDTVAEQFFLGSATGHTLLRSEDRFRQLLDDPAPSVPVLRQPGALKRGEILFQQVRQDSV